ncbi:MAG: DALR domain-containing protein, partial [Burkholderiales bacterium]
EEPSWPSRWGAGRPGWHIECSAMGCELLGRQFDIHGGGQDLQFPHHENEIAQSEGANGVRFVNYWMHNGFVRVDDEKMSKSLGNFFTVREVLERYDAEVVRFFIVRAHYRSPLNYSDQHLEDAKHALTRLYTALKDWDVQAGPVDWNDPHAARFRAAMDDDFGTPEVVAVLFELANELNRSHAREHAQRLKSLAAILGLLGRDATAFLQALPSESGLTADQIERLIAERAAARKAKNFAEADRIRDELSEAGVVLEDTAKGTLWRKQ